MNRTEAWGAWVDQDRLIRNAAHKHTKKEKAPGRDEPHNGPFRSDSIILAEPKLKVKDYPQAQT